MTQHTKKRARFLTTSWLGSPKNGACRCSFVIWKAGRNAKPLLRAAPKGSNTVEMRRRLESLLERLPVYDLGDLEIPNGMTLITADGLIAKGLQELKDANRFRRMQAVQELSELARFSNKIVPMLIETFE
jgi:hypothetical protein